MRHASAAFQAIRAILDPGAASPVGLAPLRAHVVWGHVGLPVVPLADPAGGVEVTVEARQYHLREKHGVAWYGMA